MSIESKILTGNIAEKLIDDVQHHFLRKGTVDPLTLRPVQSHTLAIQKFRCIQRVHTRAYENPQYCNLSWPIAFDILSISLATTGVETYSVTFREDSSNLVPKILLYAYAFPSASVDVLKTDG